MDTSEDTLEATAAANELYWGSDTSVNQIAEDLDLSKGALYGMIRPLRSGLGCPDCGNEAVFANRTARERGMLACPTCSWEGGEEDAHPYGGEGAVTIPVFDREDAVGPPPPVSRELRNRTLIGGACLGAAAGLALVMWARRR